MTAELLSLRTLMVRTLPHAVVIELMLANDAVGGKLAINTLADLGLEVAE